MQQGTKTIHYNSYMKLQYCDYHNIFIKRIVIHWFVRVYSPTYIVTRDNEINIPITPDAIDKSMDDVMLDLNFSLSQMNIITPSNNVGNTNENPNFKIFPE